GRGHRLGRRMFVIGGVDGAYENQVWLLELAGAPTWSPIAVEGTPPPPRSGHTAVLDRSRNRAIVFGGTDDLNGFNDVWALTLGGSPRWAPILTTGASPATRTGHGAIYDAARDRMIVYGGEYRGFRGPIGLNDVGELTFSGAPACNQLV